MKLTRKQLIEKFKSIKLLALDVDGVLTDDHIYFGPDGFELKRFNISDGFYIALAMRSGLEIAVISGRMSPATTSRVRDLGIKHVSQQMKDKRKQIAPILKKLKIDLSQVAFVGNEILDIPLAREVGLSIAVADANKELAKIAHFVTKTRGGYGAVREIIMIYFESRRLDPVDFIM